MITPPFICKYCKDGCWTRKRVCIKCKGNNRGVNKGAKSPLSMSRKYRMAKNLSFMVMIGMMFIVISMNVNALGLNNNTAVPNINQSNIIRWYRLNDTDGNMTNTTVLAMGLNVTGAFTSQYGSPDPYTTSTGAISFTGSAQYLTSGAVASTGNIAELGFAADFSVDGWVQHFRDFANDGGAEEWLFNCIERASAGRPLWGI